MKFEHKRLRGRYMYVGTSSVSSTYFANWVTEYLSLAAENEGYILHTHVFPCYML